MHKIITLLLLLSLLTTSLSANAKVRLKEAEKQFSSYSSKLSSVADEIFKYKREIKDLGKALYRLNRELKKEEFRFNKESIVLKKLQNKQEELLKKQKDVHSSIALLTASIVSLSIVTGKREFFDYEGVILDEVYSSVKKINSVKVERFNKDLQKRKKSIDEVTKKVNKLKGNIESIAKKRDSVKSKKEKRKKIALSLQKREKEYKRMLQSILNEKKSIQAEIEKLQKKKPQIDEAVKKAYAKKLGSSYQKSATGKFKGRKTISPLENYTVTKRYGNYIDPVYKIKIFNNSVTLKPKEKGAIVKNVYNGKVSLVKTTPFIGKIVIVEHYNGMQTIYAHLDSIAPAIEAGKKVKRGTVIGRVYKDLHFEVIKRSKHIDPLTVIE
jgi:murein DD-endopeptidase MepM/ murein hydrolase activator NlpD